VRRFVHIRRVKSEFIAFNENRGHKIIVSRHGQFIKDFLDDRFAGFFPGPGRDGHAWRSASSFRLHASKIVWLNLPPARVSVFRK
jgi:hypothetical protein